MARKLLFLIILVVACILLFPCNAFGLPQAADERDSSASAGPVNDAAHALSSKTIEEINRELVSFSEKRSVRLKIVTLDPDMLRDRTSLGDNACRLAEGWGLREGPANRGVVILLIKGEGVGICTTNDLNSKFKNALGERILANFILPATINGDMDSAALYAAAAMTVLLAHVIPSDGKIIRARANQGRLFQGGLFHRYQPLASFL